MGEARKRGRREEGKGRDRSPFRKFLDSPLDRLLVTFLKLYVFS